MRRASSAKDGKPVKKGDSGTLPCAAIPLRAAIGNQPERSAATMLEGGWLNTGDNLLPGRERLLRLRGRADDMMKVGRIWTSPIEIVGRLIEHPNGARSRQWSARRCRRPHQARSVDRLEGRSPPAKAPAAATLEDELREHCKKGLAPYKYRAGSTSSPSCRRRRRERSSDIKLRAS
jgi:acyl-coenzyme A synthetase/AMP-(fatty) acid ligase